MNNKFRSLAGKSMELIKNSNNIFLCSHVQPDGDNLGSTLALAMAIKKINKEVKVLKVDNIPLVFEFLPKVNMIKEYDLNQNIDLFISLDSSDTERLGSGKEFLQKAKKVINIDHHITNDNFGDINIVSPSSSSTAEVVYKLIKHMGVNIDKDMATCLYTGISTDTGRFMHSNTTYETHLIAADLIKIGIDLNKINMNIYQSKSIERIRLLIDSLSNLKLHLNGKIGMSIVTLEMLESNKASMDDAGGIVSFITDIDCIEVACLLKEINHKEVKISLRSKNELDVSRIATKFNGGGHKKAAGCTIYEGVNDAKEMILKEILESFGD